MAKKLNSSDPTAAAAIGRISNADAEELRLRAAAREAADANRNAAIARRKAAASRGRE